MLLLFSNYYHSLSYTTEMGKDRDSRNHKTARICSIRFPTWEAAESRQQAKKKQADFIMLPQNQQALIHILLLCSFVSHSGNLFHPKISTE